MDTENRVFTELKTVVTYDARGRQKTVFRAYFSDGSTQEMTRLYGYVWPSTIRAHIEHWTAFLKKQYPR